MSVTSIVQNELIEDPSLVWLLRDHSQFGYSEETASEKYLEQVLRSAGDLSSRSSELESYIKDWPSEYHLTAKRAQLLSGFRFDRPLKVLEIGCDCGAITRYLGELFDRVVSIEASLTRARLARLRNRDVPSVSIICGPFQEIRFLEKFDIIFVAGAWPSGATRAADGDPHDAILEYFSDVLAPDGVVVMAIENQFGLKYFNGFAEHLEDRPFAALEGHHRVQQKLRTFGKVELERRVKRYFPNIRLFYPYPDHKLPNCVLSSKFLASGRAAEIVSQMTSRDYSRAVRPLWAEPVVKLELARNKALEFFSNSFLLIAGRGELEGVAFDQLAILYSTGRKSTFATETRIIDGPDGDWIVQKRSRQGLNIIDGGAIRMVDTDAPWLAVELLQTQVSLRSMSNNLSLGEIFAPCRKWVELLMAESNVRDGIRYVSGAHIDSILPNVYVVGPDVHIIDREWIWHDDIPLNVVFIRAIYEFSYRFRAMPGVGKALGLRSGRALIRTVATAFGLEVSQKDFEDFIQLESEMQWIVFGSDKKRHRIYLRWFLADMPTLTSFQHVRQKTASILSGLRPSRGTRADLAGETGAAADEATVCEPSPKQEKPAEALWSNEPRATEGRLKISVALCTYNGARFLSEQLASIAVQTRLPDEMIVCDDRSTDGTRDIIEKFAAQAPFEVRWAVNDDRLGVPQNFEKAISLCTGDVIFFCDQDDYWQPEKIDLLISCFMQDQNIGLVFTNASVTDLHLNSLGYTMWDTVRLDKTSFRRVNGNDALSVLASRHLVTGTTAAFRATLRDKILPIPSMYMHDAWVAGVAAACSRVVALEQPLVMYRQHDSNVVGGVKLGLGQTIRHSRGTPPQEFDLEILRSLKLAERLRTLPDAEAIRRGIDVIQSKLDHLKARRSMFDRPFFSGLPVIAGELLSSRYAEFSSGLSSSLVDLFRLGVRYNLKSRVGHR